MYTYMYVYIRTFGERSWKGKYFGIRLYEKFSDRSSFLLVIVRIDD